MWNCSREVERFYASYVVEIDGFKVIQTFLLLFRIHTRLIPLWEYVVSQHVIMGQIPPEQQTIPVSWTTIEWNTCIIQIQHGNEELWPGHRYWVCVHCDLGLEDMTLGLGYDTCTPLDHGHQWREISRSNMAVKLWSAPGIWVCVHCDLDLWDMTLVQGHDTPLDHGQQLSEILSRSDNGVRRYGLDTMWTDGQTDGRTDRMIPIYPNILFAGEGGYKNHTGNSFASIIDRSW